MSYSFYAHGEAPDFDLLRTYPEPLFVDGMEPGAHPMGRFQDGEVLHVYRHGVTTRSVEIAYEHGAFSARVLTLACAEDYRIALHLVCEAARRVGGQVESEEGVRFAPDEVDAHYGPAWIAQHIAQLVDMTALMAREHGEISMLGAGAQIHLDPATLDRVFAGIEEPLARAEALFALFREVNYPPQPYYPANPLRLSLQDGSAQTLVSCAPTVAYQFPRADVAAVQAGEGMMLIPWESFCEIARVVPVDAATVRMEAVTEAQWPALLERLRPHRLDQGGEADEPPHRPQEAAPPPQAHDREVPLQPAVVAHATATPDPAVGPRVLSGVTALVVGGLTLALQAPLWIGVILALGVLVLGEWWARRAPAASTPTQALPAPGDHAEPQASEPPADAPRSSRPPSSEPSPDRPTGARSSAQAGPSGPAPVDEPAPEPPADRPSAADLLRQMKGEPDRSGWTANLRHLQSLVYSERDRERLWRRAHRGDAGSHRPLSTIDVPTEAERQVLERLVAELGSGR